MPRKHFLKVHISTTILIELNIWGILHTQQNVLGDRSLFGQDIKISTKKSAKYVIWME
jgi:hypothetical protein